MAQMTEQKLKKYFALSLISKKGIPGWEDLHNEMQRLIFDIDWAEKTGYDTARTFRYPGES
jgi:hypothetical protein